MSRTPRRRKRISSTNHERWLLTYADMITLLLIFFVVMFAMSRLDVEKYQAITQSLQSSFKSGNSILDEGSGLLDGGNSLSGNAAGGGKGDKGKGENNSTGTVEKEEDENQPLTAREIAFRKQEEELNNLMNMIEQYIKENKLEDQISVNDLPKGISITLNDRFLFDIGQANLKSDSTETLKRLASLFKQLQTMISIEGHTDNLPITSKSKYADNWELSGARALSVLRYFIDKEDLNPEGFQYAGYADTRPAGDNNTSAGRQKNRRVEITVLRQLQQ
ncbi:chemotaxis protein MotB [Paenibacillus turicensis]|uniref:Chemotaxis protein MotB n=1 Tax=Paenibacillus turicensis TaxID=160487 RepID=A0ABS4FX84_9BACL|nr:flagellar motor protein MotB [Paenibacillus turicensis]MBP1907196.1 chemotaxis protein MotB [Paenibacillus turicensis]